MERRVAFIGHRGSLPRDIEDRIAKAVQNQINLGCKKFIVGSHGDFDNAVLSVCKKFKREQGIDIEIVITSLNQIKRQVEYDQFGRYVYEPFDGLPTVYYEIENVHFKQQITKSNQQMIDSSDTLICYVNENKERSGAKQTLKYAIKKGLTVINLFDKKDKTFYF